MDANPQTPDEAAVRQAALDYAEGWFEGDPQRMAHSLHPKLVKRALKVDPDTGTHDLNYLTKDDMVRLTTEGGGLDVPRDTLIYKIDILEIVQEIAVVRCETTPYIDHLQLVKQNGQWQIANILYTFKPKNGN
jgi:hypothetical protein